MYFETYILRKPKFHKTLRAVYGINIQSHSLSYSVGLQNCNIKFMRKKRSAYKWRKLTSNFHPDIAT